MMLRVSTLYKKTIKSVFFCSIVVWFIFSGVQAQVFSQKQLQPQSRIVFASEHYTICLHDQTSDMIRLSYHISDFSTEEVRINDQLFTRIILGDTSTTFEAGKPELPLLAHSIILPDASNMQVSHIQTQYQEFDSIQVVPSKGNLLRTMDPDATPYYFDELYTRDAWFPERIVSLSEPYILRDFRGCCIQVIPFQYNPVEKKLRVYSDIFLELTSADGQPVNPLFRTKVPSHVDSEFLQLYQRHFLNFPALGYTPVPEQGNMLVVTDDQFYDLMKPFVAWKNMRGLPTEMVNISRIGDATALKQYITNYYETTGVAFVLLVGDVQQIPTLYRSGGASDPSYTYVVGSDHYPDLFIGRFSAQTNSQLQTQIQRTLDYEQHPQVDAVWYRKGTGIASNQGPGDNGEYDDEHIENIRNLLLNYTYITVDQIYDPTASVSQVVSALNDGRGVINYCGHGWPMGWGTTGFSTTHVHSLINKNTLPFIVSVACNNGEFDSFDECFAEAWLRATAENQPTGAIGVFMSSVSQSWNPPMAAQDEIMNLLVESYTDNKKHTFGGLCFSGCMYMNDRYGYAGAEMTDTWHVFGDPSLMVRTTVPTLVSASHPSEIMMGANTFEVTVSGGADLIAAVSKNGKLFGSGYPDENGHVLISFSDPVPPGGVIDLVVVGYNTVPYHAYIPIIGDDEPPYTPEKPSGRRFGRVNISYGFSTCTKDPENQDVYYLWDFGDGQMSEWDGPYVSGARAFMNHSWMVPRMYTVRVKAKDVVGAESNWSEPVKMFIPKNKALAPAWHEHGKPLFPRFAELVQRIFTCFS
ncbi:MAG: C25 family cysteine peptidase [Candidatus Thermoplasmatota archaeon]